MSETMDTKIRWPIIFFGVFIALLLFQPEGLGTYAALGSMIVLVFSCILEGSVSFKKFYFPIESRMLTLFLVEAILITLMRMGTPSGLYKYIAQIVLFLILQNISISRREHNFIKWSMMASTSIYAIEAIRYCIKYQSIRYVHSNIVLFGASFDPNFIGLTFVIAFILFFDNVLNNNYRLISMLGMLLTSVAIIFTSSRGNFVGLLLGSVLVLYTFLGDKNVKMAFRLFGIVFSAILLAVFIIYFLSAFPQQWARMTDFSSVADNGRYGLWQESIQLFEKHMLFGNGFRSMFIINGRASHNTYLQLLVENGLLGFGIIMILIFRLYQSAKKYDIVLSVALVTLLAQIFFLDAFDNRCVWAIFCWIAMLPRRDEYDEYIK